MNKPLKIIQINACRDYKSTGVIVKAIGEMAEQHGMTMYYAYQSCLESTPNSYQVGTQLDWKWHALVSRLTGREGYASRHATKKMLHWMDEIKPDIVHLHNIHSHYIHFNTLFRYLAQKHIPTVITLHDCWYFTGKCSHYVAVSCNKWKTNCGECPLLKAEVPSWFIDPTARVLKDRIKHINAISNLYLVGCSQWISREAKKSLIKPREILTIYNGVNLDIFKPHESSFRKEHSLGKKFLIMGMADKWSNPANFAAVEYIAEKVGEDAAIVIVGCTDANKAYFSQFKNIITIGYVSEQARLADIYADVNVFVNLTHADTLPTVNMEAIACGTPVITYDCCGSPELITPHTGIVIPEDDYFLLYEYIKKIKDGLLTYSIAEQKNFNKNKCFEKYVELYKLIVNYCAP